MNDWDQRAAGVDFALTENHATAAPLHRLVRRFALPNWSARRLRTAVRVGSDCSNVATESVRYLASDAVDFFNWRFSRRFLNHFQVTPLVCKSPEWAPQRR